MIDETKLHKLELFFKLFGDKTRLKVIHLLSQHELCVRHIAQHLNLEQSTVSHQLRILKQAHIVKTKRAGKMIYYTLDDDHVSTIFKQGLEHINEKA